MHYKSKVLARHPAATLVVLRRYPDSEPKYVRVYVGESGLDIHQPDDGDGWGGERQLHAAAWRSAYFCLVREDRARKEAA